MVSVKRIIWIASLWLFISAAGCLLLFFFFRPAIGVAETLDRAIIQLGEKTLKVEVARTPAQLYRGLSGRDVLCPECGMLFEFSGSGERKFVMRDMKFPLDIFFISDGRINKIEANLPPEGAQPKNIYRSAADEVLELNGGYAAKNGIKVNDTISKIKSTISK